MKDFKDTIVIAMGGSLLIPESIDLVFIKQLKEMMKALIDKNYQIALVVGGGKVCRIYQNAAREFDNVSDVDLDWIGIKTIRLNAELLLRAFSDLNIHKEVIEKWEEAESIKENLIIVGAWEPGCSSDTDAVELARVLGSKKVINFSNTSHVYDKDPNKYPDAQKFEKLSWKEYKEIIPKEWVPGMPAPFDPVASRIAEENNISVAVLGASVENLENYLNNRKFEGTILK
jgi:uridylate kinase